VRIGECIRWLLPHPYSWEAEVLPLNNTRDARLDSTRNRPGSPQADLAISVQNRLNKWTGFTGFTGLCNLVNPGQSC
jgi:hypothetical protein